MKTISLIILGCAIVGCNTSTPNWDSRFGDSVREARRKMTINPDAGKQAEPVAGMDGPSAHNAVILYHDTFKEPPPVVNVINIGGTIGGH
jgi:hypothetical protein